MQMGAACTTATTAASSSKASKIGGRRVVALRPYDFKDIHGQTIVSRRGIGLGMCRK